MDQSVVNSIVEECLEDLKSVNRKSINLPKLLTKCNPYSLVVKCKTSEDIVDSILKTHQQTSSETIWGYYLETIAVKISEMELNGFKSKQVCTDIEWEVDGKKHFRGWKSSPNWSNADQKRTVNRTEQELKESEDFGSFKVLTSYGKTIKRNKDYNKFTQLSGQDAWEEISNDEEMYNKVMLAITNNSEKIGQFIDGIYISDRKKSIDWVNENFTEDGRINYTKINKYVSGRDKVKVTKW